MGSGRRFHERFFRLAPAFLLAPVFRLAPVFLLALAAAACSEPATESKAPPSREAPAPAERPAILLLTLDTTRADAMGYESEQVETPALEALAARGTVFSQAYATAPMTLPSHTSMLTGLYPAEHGIHENSRVLAEGVPLLAERLQEAGYGTAAFVSAFPLARPFGLARGFGRFDDDLGEASERSSEETAGRVLAHLGETSAGPRFLWVHFFDPHDPYEPPEPYRSRYPDSPYLAEVAAMDAQVGRVVEAFEAAAGDRPVKILVAGDHGEGLGEHGEALHGNLLYQGTMRVPLILAGTEIPAARRDDAVSVRQVFPTVLRWAGLAAVPDGGAGGGDGAAATPLTEESRQPVLAEAMKPFLQYGWQPQVMAVLEGVKVIRAGDLEVYDLKRDPSESQDLGKAHELDRQLRRALQEYPLPGEPGVRDEGGGPAAGESLSPEDQQRLASLGYSAQPGRARQREDAPSPRRMTHLFGDLDRGSRFFAAGRYEEAIPVYRRVLEADPENFTVTLRLAVAHSVAGRDDRASELFARARRLDAGSADLRHYEAMHHLRFSRWAEASALFESVLAAEPRRLPALQGLARALEEQERLPEAVQALERALPLVSDRAGTLVQLGDLRMSLGRTAAATAAYEEASGLQGEAFRRHLELGVLYLADGRPEEARSSLDQVPPEHPAYPMALFKRAQVSVLLGEPDQARRIELARRHADSVTGPLIEEERLFQGVTPPL